MRVETETGQHITISDDPNDVIVGVDFHRALFTERTLTGRIFDSCEFRNAHFERSTLAHVTFSNCRLPMADATAAALTAVTFENCLLNFARFERAALENVTFDSVRLTRASFKGAEFRGTVTTRALVDADFSGARCARSTRWVPNIDLSAAGVVLL